MIASQLVGIYIYIWLFLDVHGLHGLLVESAGILIEEEPRLHNYTLWVYQVVAANKEHSTCYKETSKEPLRARANNIKYILLSIFDDILGRLGLVSAFTSR